MDIGHRYQISSAILYNGEQLLQDDDVLQHRQHLTLRASSVEGGIKIFVKPIMERTIILQCHPADTIEMVKMRIADREGTAVDHQLLRFADKRLENDRTLADYNIQNECSIWLVLLLRGGGSPLDGIANTLDLSLEKMSAVLKASPAVLDVDAKEDMVSFAPAAKPYPAFQKHCTDWLDSSTQLPTRLSELHAVVRRYTGDSIYKKLNLSLALDYDQVICTERDYIKKLLFSIMVLPGYQGSNFLRRGVDLTDKEVEAMRTLGEFYIPGFTSTSSSGGEFGDKNTILEIDARDGERVTLDIGNSPHIACMTDYMSEGETLIAAYTKFKFIDMTPAVEESRQPRRITLKILDPLEEHGEILDLYHHSKFGRWGKLFEAIDGQAHKAQVMVRYAKPTSGWTILHQAAWWGRQDVVDQLLRLGFKPNRKDKSGKTARDVASDRGKGLSWV
mmetsp:Transcript_26788/g.48853  ORF Transcript_26788/g.48853 Transcript_26788/m.48853 type:complete len:447 (-) Transcript_26788:379-1719(-)